MRKLFIPILLLATLFTQAQKSSIDLAFIRNTHTDLNGLNLSYFHHFNERLTGGLEMNRFFTKRVVDEDAELDLSAWDFDLNLHYLLPLNKYWRIYPITGISHTSEKEIVVETQEKTITRFWSYNAGAGVLFQSGKWAPHAEYLFTFGHMNQQFFLAGISYEIEWK